MILGWPARSRRREVTGRARPLRSDPETRSCRRLAAGTGLAVLAVLFVVLSALVWDSGTEVGLDRTLSRLTTISPVRELINDGRPLETRPERTVLLGSPAVVSLLAAALAVVAVTWRDRAGAVLALAGPGLTGALTQYLLKPLVTPDGLASGRAFPSGHAGGATSVALVAVVLIHREWGWGPALLVAPPAVLSALLVGHAVVRLNYHYPTDAAGGMLLALWSSWGWPPPCPSRPAGVAEAPAGPPADEPLLSIAPSGARVERRLGYSQCDVRLRRLCQVAPGGAQPREQAKAVPGPQRLQRIAEVLRVDTSDLMRYAGYLPNGEPAEVQADGPFHQLLGQISQLTNDQLVVLIDQAWEEHRGRAGFSLDQPTRVRRGGGPRADHSD